MMPGAILAATTCLLLAAQPRDKRFIAWFIAFAVLVAVAYVVTDGVSVTMKTSAYLVVAMALSAVFGYALGRRRAWVTGALTLVTLLIIKLSTPSGSAEGWHEWLMSTFGLNEATAIEAVHWIRKVIHFCAYGTCALTTWHWFKAGGWAGRGLLALALGWAVGLACFDEVRQSQYAMRQGRASDVVLDFSGSATFLALNALRRRRAV